MIAAEREALRATRTHPPVDTSVEELEFRLSRDKETLKVSFDYDGMEARQGWLYRTYIDDVLTENFSIEPEGFGFDVPSGTSSSRSRTPPDSGAGMWSELRSSSTATS